jgi:hypothetical protein
LQRTPVVPERTFIRDEVQGETMVLNKIGASLVVATVLSTVLVMASAVGITFYAFAAQSSVGLDSVYAVSVERDGEFGITFGPGFFLTFAAIVALLTLVISFLQIRTANRGGR